MIKVGILGCAAIARRSLAPAFLKHDRFDLRAVASRSAEKARQFACDVSCPTLTANTYDELVDDADIDLVYCPLPTGLHFEWVKKCLWAGKHVLCEKSLACTGDEVEELVEIARSKNLLLMESFQFRFHAQNLYVKDLLRQRKIGEVRNIVVRFGIPPFPDGEKNIRYSQELGGGALLDNGAYTIKAATYLLGRDIEVLASMWDVNRTAKDGVGDDVDLTGSLMMRTKTGVSVLTSYGFSHYYQNGYEIWGTLGKISTMRAFTAREDFAAPVVLETREGREERTFNDDHFVGLLDHVSDLIEKGCFADEYEECLIQAKLLQDAREKMR